MQTVNDVLIKARDIYWVEASDTIRQVVRYMCERKTGAVAVKENDEVVGIFSERDLMHRVVNAGLSLDDVKVREVMTSNVLTINAEDDIRCAKLLMHENRVRHLLVTGKGNVLKGLVSMRDLIEADMNEINQQIQKLNDVYYEKAYKSNMRIAGNRVIVEPYVSAH